MAELADKALPLPRASVIDPHSSARDGISIKNLQLPYGIIAPDVWGKSKEQPALISITLLLQGCGFGSAADADKLDDSTIHYGTLAKQIRASCTPHLTAGELSYHVECAIKDLARKSDGRFIVARSTVEVRLPKACMFGEGLSLINATTYDFEGRTTSVARVFSVQEVKIMTLIGVNGYERSMKQPLVASLLLHLRPEAQTHDSSQTVALFNMEQMLVQIIQDTSFETLETLADFAVTQLRKRILDAVLPGTRVQLRIEKPRAIAFADAPAVEIVRDVPFAKCNSSLATSRRSTRGSSGASDSVAATATATTIAMLQGSPVRSRLPAQSRGPTPSVVAAVEADQILQRLSVVKPYNGLAFHPPSA